MNFKFLLVISVLLFVGCGVKSRPVSPPETAIQSYTNSYLEQSVEKDKDHEIKPPVPVK